MIPTVEQHDFAESFPDPVSRFDPHGCCEFVNPAMARLFGGESERLLGRSLRDWPLGCSAEAIEQIDKSIEGTFTERTPHTLHVECATGAGTRVLEMRFHAESGQNGAGVWGIFRDVTELARAESALRESEENLRRAQAVAQTGSWHLDIVTGQIRWSDETYRMFGIPAGTALTFDHIFEFVHPDDRAPVARAWEAALSGVPYDIEHRIVVRDELRWVRERAEVRFDAADTPLEAVGTVQDITQRRAASQRLSLLEFALNNVREAVYLIDKNARFQFVNDEACRALGRSCTELLKLGVLDIDPGLDWDFWTKLWSTLQEEGAFTMESRHHASDGRVFPVEISANYFEYAGRAYNLALVRDISDRKAAELAQIRTRNELEQSEARLEEASRIANIGYWDCDLVAETMTFSTRACSVYGLPLDKLVYSLKEWMDWRRQVIHPDDRQLVRTALDESLNRSGGYDIEYRLLLQDGETRYIHCRGEVKRDPTGNALRIFGTTQNVTEQTLAKRALAESEAKLRSILENVGIGVALISPDMEILELNRRMREWFPGIETQKHPICYQSFNDPPRDAVCTYCPVIHTLKDGQVHESTTQTPQGDRVSNYRIVSSPILNAAGEVTAAIEMVEDITERLSLEAQLQQSQKMEAVGRLAGGVAHDFNNMLCVILGHAEMVLSKLDPDDPSYMELEEIRQAAERSADLTRQLLAFARRQTIRPRALSLDDAVDGMLSMLRRLIGEDIRLEWTPGNVDWAVCMDPSQLHQILANLCVNARDAIGGIGLIQIETGAESVGHREHKNQQDVTPGDFVFLSVRDNGCGMDEDTRGKVFEPFFTTKSVGQGTGLGLSMVYGIVKQNNGFIEIDSAPGCGSTFKIFLPRHFARRSQSLEERLGNPVLRGHETVLVVEDEPAILRMAQLVLKECGYTVLAAASPPEALEIARNQEGDIHLLVTDVVMPEMNGRQLARALMSLYPDVKSLFMSGYTGDIIAQNGILHESVNFIQKPFSMSTLAAKVREVINSD